MRTSFSQHDFKFIIMDYFCIMVFHFYHLYNFFPHIYSLVTYSNKKSTKQRTLWVKQCGLTQHQRNQAMPHFQSDVWSCAEVRLILWVAVPPPCELQPWGESDVVRKSLGQKHLATRGDILDKSASIFCPCEPVWGYADMLCHRCSHHNVVHPNGSKHRCSIEDLHIYIYQSKSPLYFSW